MTISIVTLFCDLYAPFLKASLLGRAQAQGLISFDVVSLFNYAAQKERIDAPTFGHGAGMLLRPDVIERAISDREKIHGPGYKVFFSPQGEKLDADVLKTMYHAAQEKRHIMLLPARYEGMDARVEEYYADKVISVGDFVLMGGDLPAMMLIEGFARYLPGVVGKQESILNDSFASSFVDYPEYTVPLEWKGMKVPDVVRSGDHKKIMQWRANQAAQKSVLEHFGWVRTHQATSEEEKLIASCIPSHYAILMHSQILLPNGEEGCTSVTSLDIHDIARSAHTYGLKKYFIVTPLRDQQKIIQTLLDFWASDHGINYNPHRHEALENVILVSTLDEALELIKHDEGKDAFLMGTSARISEHHQHKKPVSYDDQSFVWSREQPVALIFGTGRGLASSVISRCDGMLPPVKGFSPFNHLSVRSAAAIVFDRWLGSNVKKINHSFA